MKEQLEIWKPIKGYRRRFVAMPANVLRVYFSCGKTQDQVLD